MFLRTVLRQVLGRW